MTKIPNLKGDNVQPDRPDSHRRVDNRRRFPWSSLGLNSRVVGAYLAVGAWGALVVKALTDNSFNPPQMIYAVPAAAGWFLWQASKNGDKGNGGTGNGGGKSG